MDNDNVIHVDFANRGRALKSDPQTLINSANRLARGGEHQAALSLYHRACLAEPERWEVHYNLGFCLYEMQDFPSAIASLERALLLAPDSGDVLMTLASALWTAGKRHEAETHWRRYLDLEPRGKWASVACRRLAQIQAIW